MDGVPSRTGVVMLGDFVGSALEQPLWSVAGASLEWLATEARFLSRESTRTRARTAQTFTVVGVGEAVCVGVGGRGRTCAFTLRVLTSSAAPEWLHVARPKQQAFYLVYSSVQKTGAYTSTHHFTTHQESGKESEGDCSERLSGPWSWSWSWPCWSGGDLQSQN